MLSKVNYENSHSRTGTDFLRENKNGEIGAPTAGSENITQQQSHLHIKQRVKSIFKNNNQPSQDFAFLLHALSVSEH